jgi:hypothetical protein
MVRDQLEKLYGVRMQFKAQFLHLGKKVGGKKRDRLLLTAILLDVKDAKTETLLTDHLWFNFAKQFEQLKLKSGDVLEFFGRIYAYQKGYSEDDEERPFETDYCVKYPSQMRVIGHAEGDFSHDEEISTNVRKVVADHEMHRRATWDRYLEKVNAPKAKMIPEVKPKMEEKPKKIRDLWSYLLEGK